MGRTTRRGQLCGGAAVPSAPSVGCRLLSRGRGVLVAADCQRHPPPAPLLRGGREAILRCSYPSSGVCSGHSAPKFPGPRGRVARTRGSLWLSANALASVVDFVLKWMKSMPLISSSLGEKTWGRRWKVDAISNQSHDHGLRCRQCG